MAKLLLLLCVAAAAAAGAAAAGVDLVTFDGAKDTTYNFYALNDPVMGGKSKSTFTVDKANNIAVFDGTVAIVPSLQAPGFCVAQTSNGLGIFTSFNDASPYTHLTLRVRSTIPYTGFKVSFAADTLNWQFASFKADFTLKSNGEWEEVSIPFTAFSNKWSSATGEPTVKCSDDKSVCPTAKNLKDITNIGVWMEGAAGDFHLEIASIRAETPEPATVALVAGAPMEALSDYLELFNFGGKDAKKTFSWVKKDDPVMGGASSSTWSIDTDAGVGTLDGEVRDVPFLKAPGFCKVNTADGGGLRTIFPDAAGYSHLLVRARSTKPYTGFKVSFAANTFNPAFHSFKADLPVPSTGEWTDVLVPLVPNFSNDWSPYTGECSTKDPTGKQHVCCDPNGDDAARAVCVTDKDLGKIQDFGFWAEGEKGEFHLEVQHVYAVNTAAAAGDDAAWASFAAAAWQNQCSGPVQSGLRYNMDAQSTDNLSRPAAPGETLAQAVCCDKAFLPLAEPVGLYGNGDVALFDKLTKGGETTFYDSVCGLPLFTVPRGRTLDEFKADTAEHGWPSFRPDEVHTENVITDKTTGEVHSKCGTHLGSFLPDEQGDRWCMDLVCISGNPLRLRGAYN